MSNNEVTTQTNETAFKVITYTQEVSFSYTLPEENEQQSIEHELTFVWEDTLQKFLDEHGAKTPYEIHTFKREREQKLFIEQVESIAS